MDNDKKVDISTKPFMDGFTLSFDGHGVNRKPDDKEKYPQRLAKLTGPECSLNPAEITYFGNMFATAPAMFDLLSRISEGLYVGPDEIREVIDPLKTVNVWESHAATLSKPSKV
jgi:hypothetical protein